MNSFELPGRYIQGLDKLTSMNKYIKHFADNWLVLADKSVISLLNCFDRNNDGSLFFYKEVFEGECSRDEIYRLALIAETHECKGVIGFGGGRVLDVAKAVANVNHLCIVMVPTSAATNAASTTRSIIYNKKGEFEGYMFNFVCPDAIIVDSSLIAHAPSRLIVSGMGNTLSTLFETYCGYDADVIIPDKLLDVKKAIKDKYFKVLLQEGNNARTAVEQNKVTTALELIIEANLYSGIVVNKTGNVVVSHAISAGLAPLLKAQNLLYGEIAAFCTLTQLVMQQTDMNMIDKIQEFCLSVGLPVCLGQIGISKYVHEKMRSVAEITYSKLGLAVNESFNVNVKQIYDSLLIADELGRRKTGLKI